METILLTGASGYLGKMLYEGLEAQYKIRSLGRSSNLDIVCNLSSNVPSLISTLNYVIHAAGHAHEIPTTKEEKERFFSTNYQGTKNLLIGLENLDRLPKGIVYISSVAVYGINEGENVNEGYPLLGSIPYSKSKIMTERLVKKWGKKNQVTIGILRLPLIFGPNPPGNLGKMIKSFKKGYYPRIGDGSGRKSVVYGPDLANMLPTLFQIGGTYNLTDGHHPSFKELEDSMGTILRKKAFITIPMFLAKILAQLGDWAGPNSLITSSKLSKITKSLTFDDTKAREELGWRPTKVLDVMAKVVT